MAFFNFSFNFNINLGRPRFGFNVGCYSFPSFFCRPNFNFSPIMPSFQRYNNISNIMQPSLFNMSYSMPPPVSLGVSFNNFCIGQNVFWQNSSCLISNTDTFSSSGVYKSNALKKGKLKTEKEERVEDQNDDPLKFYNKRKGEKLANIALQNSVGWRGQCATYVKNAISKANLGEYETGDAHKTDEILEDNPNFKKISTSSVDVNDLPAGCVLVYEKGVQGYSKEYGHVEITTGDGRGVSDGITKNLRKPSSIFVPV